MRQKQIAWALLVWLVPSYLPAQQPATLAKPEYEFREEHDPNGIGKFYMGREIAQVMGHLGAGWLERPSREREEQPTKLLESLRIEKGSKVADIGAGSGYFTVRLAKLVGETGTVYAVDIQPEMLTILRNRAKKEGLENIELVQGTIVDPKLPADTIDLILLVDVYHEFSHPWEMADAMIRSLKPGGRIVFVEYRLEDPSVPIKRVHKMSEEQVRKEMSVQQVRWVETIDVLPRQHIIIFEKPTEPSNEHEPN